MPTLALTSLWTLSILFHGEPLLVPDPHHYTEEQAQNIIRAAREVLHPVYRPLAQFCVKRYRLSKKKAIGIDLGGGPGFLAVELAKLTPSMHWINADINPFYFSFFFEEARRNGVAGRVSALFADVHSLPFRSNYADIIVSRGSFHFWSDKTRAFGEIYRVLKPGGTALVGRGFSPNLPVDTARAVRATQKARGRIPVYDLEETRRELEKAVRELKIKNYKFLLPHPPGSEGVNYGIWLEIRKPGGGDK